MWFFSIATFSGQLTPKVSWIQILWVYIELPESKFSLTHVLPCPPGPPKLLQRAQDGNFVLMCSGTSKWNLICLSWHLRSLIWPATGSGPYVMSKCQLSHVKGAHLNTFIKVVILFVMSHPPKALIIFMHCISPCRPVSLWQQFVPRIEFNCRFIALL